MRKLMNVATLVLTVFIALGMLSVLTQMVCILIGNSALSALIGTWGVRLAGLFGAILSICSYLYSWRARKRN